MLIAIPSRDRGYFRGMGRMDGLLGLLRRGLGDDTSGIDWSTVDLSGNSQPPILPNIGPQLPPIPPTINPTINVDLGSAALTSPLPPIPAPPNTVLAAQPGGGVMAVPKPGYTVNAQGQVVPASSSLAGLSASLASVPSSYWLIGIVALVAISATGRKKRR